MMRKKTKRSLQLISTDFQRLQTDPVCKVNAKVAKDTGTPREELHLQKDMKNMERTLD